MIQIRLLALLSSYHEAHEGHKVKNLKIAVLIFIDLRGEFDVLLNQRMKLKHHGLGCLI